MGLVSDIPRPCVVIDGEVLTHGEIESLRCAVTAMHSEMSDPDALGDDGHGRMMVKVYRRDMERILRLMGVIK